MLWVLPAGLLAGFVLGYLGAGGTVIGLPFVLFLAGLPPHMALGTNALGVSLIAAALLAFRIWQGKVNIADGLVFALPGLAGIYSGVRLGLIFPGQKLVFLLGFLLFFVSAWMFYLSTQLPANPADSTENGLEPPRDSRAPKNGILQAVDPPPRETKVSADQNSKVRYLRMALVALLIGLVAGFFGIGGGFLIVPGLVLAGNMGLMEAAATSLLPIAVFSGWIGVQYLLSGSAQAPLSGMMLGGGLFGGWAGIEVGRRLSKKTSQQIFAVFLLLLGIYMIVR